MVSQPSLRYDALVLGGGIAGLEAALNLAEQDFSVAVVEKDASIGGKMIRLSKVFPTLDCSSCITTPKMAAAAHHPKITLLTYCELQTLERRGDDLVAAIHAKAPLCGPGKMYRLPPVRISVPGPGARCRARRLGGPEGHLHSLLQRHSPEGPDRYRRTAFCAAAAKRSAPPRRSTTSRNRKISP